MNPSALNEEASAPVVKPGSFLTLHYRLSGPDGAALVDTFDDKPATLSLGTGELAPAMEARLLGLPEGTRRSFVLEAGEAFGERNPELLQRVKRSLLAEHGDP
ncbi:MAG TPA: FKBP-type peptidyl-prolyl cis-trans isomerase, partial [Burkholderiaceae bacterium]